jgi:hypothetical protein
MKGASGAFDGGGTGAGQAALGLSLKYFTCLRYSAACKDALITKV